MDLINKLDSKNKKILDIIKNYAEKFNVNAYLVGGPVRDLIMGNSIKDIDFLIEGDAIEFAFQSGLKIKSIHEDFKTAKVEIMNEIIDIASTRSENYPEMGCLPVLEKVGIKIEEDLRRRDFTVNAIALNIKTGDIIDPFCGQEDIKNKVLKILHDKSFKDDPTRILRGYDFKYRFNFEFDKNTENLIKNCPNGFDNGGLSIDRIYLTLNKIFQNPAADKILKDIIQNKTYKIWTNKIGISVDEIDALKKTASLFKIEEKNKLYLMALENCPYVKVSFKDDFEIYNFFKKFNSVQLAFYYFKTDDNSALQYLKIKDIKPLITGKTLIDKGFSEGPLIGEILNSIQKEKILSPNTLISLDDELNFAIKNFRA